MPNLEEPQYEPFRDFFPSWGSNDDLYAILRLVDAGQAVAAAAAVDYVLGVGDPGGRRFARVRDAAVVMHLFSLAPADLPERVRRQKSDITDVDPAWRTTVAVGLAESMWVNNRFEQMPVLADALEEAGCQDGQVLARCRSGLLHYRTDWVVRRLLDKP